MRATRAGQETGVTPGTPVTPAKIDPRRHRRGVQEGNPKADLAAAGLCAETSTRDNTTAAGYDRERSIGML